MTTHTTVVGNSIYSLSFLIIKTVKQQKHSMTLSAGIIAATAGEYR
jgi:hypothetical protein